MKILILMIVPCIMLFYTNRTYAQVVKFEYIGVGDRYMPPILFYADKYTRDSLQPPILGPFKLSIKEMKSLIHYITTDNKFVSNEGRFNRYEVSFSSGNKIDTLFITNRHKWSAVFKNVSHLIEDSKKRKRVKEDFDFLLSY